MLVCVWLDCLRLLGMYLFNGWVYLCCFVDLRIARYMAVYSSLLLLVYLLACALLFVDGWFGVDVGYARVVALIAWVYWCYCLFS